MTVPNPLPLHDQLADEDDELDWDRSALGLMADHASDVFPYTIPVESASLTRLPEEV